jgi:hypothetical protein
LAHARLEGLDRGRLVPLASAGSQAAADQLYLDTTRKLVEGLERALEVGRKSSDPAKLRVQRIWEETATNSER